METGRKKIGYQEVPHTADWALTVWAPEPRGLLAAAAEGMYSLMGIRFEQYPIIDRVFKFDSDDLESLLVSFLSELLYITESEKIGFDSLELNLSGHKLIATCTGRPIFSVNKEIKAVTFHNLSILNKGDGLEVTIVFDV